MRIENGFTVLLALFVLSACTASGSVSLDSGRGDHLVTEADYERAAELLGDNVRSKVWHHQISPEWIDGDQFWYRVRTVDGHRFIRVNPETRERVAAFDHERLSEALQEVLEEGYESGELPFRSFRYIQDMERIRFEAGKKLWECDLREYECTESDRAHRPDDSVLSPDERWAAFIRDHNMWVRDMESGEDFALTTTGERRFGFGTNSQGWFRSDRPVLHWAPDSRKIATYRLDERGVEEMHLLEMAQYRPILDSWPYALPGDSIVPIHERAVLDVESRTKTWLDAEPSHQRTSNCCGLEREGQWTDITWSEDGTKMAYVTTSRDYRQVDLYIADTETGDVRHVMRESAETFFESNLSSRGIPNWRVLFDHEKVIWFSRRDDWGHLYLYSLEDGQPLGRITGGSWNVLDLLHVDEGSGDLFFTAVGKENERDPYLSHLYHVNIDDVMTGEPDTGPVLLTPEEANHQIAISPSGRFFVDEYSTFRQPSVTVVRDLHDAVQVAKAGEHRDRDDLVIERAEIDSLLETAWTKPEPFTVKARDGETDLYGLMYKPSTFDESQHYPVVVNIYPGPQTGSIGTRSFSAIRRGQTHALAELGFIVIQLDAMGTPLRSKSFHTEWYGDMSDNGLEDQVSAIRQLGQRHEWLDADRAGMYGHSGGGYATVSALLDYPGVFRAGVAGAGNMDNRGYTYYWGEKYQGQRTIKQGHDSFASQAIWKRADQLEDRLMLTYGTTDSNVHPNMTLLLIDELIKANKDFDLIVMPNRNHGYANEKYVIRRTWDYFVRHLLETEPPDDFTLD